MAPIPLPFLHDTIAALPSIPHLNLRRSLSNLSRLIARQNIVVVPQSYANQNNSPAPGTVAGIVLGCVFGILFFLWLIYNCFNLGGGPIIAASGVASDVEIVRRRSRSPRRSRRSASETIEVREHHAHRRERSPRRRETVIIEETRRHSAGPAPVIVEEDDERSDDIVEVIEEHSPPPRRRDRRPSSGYRNVDPEAFAGGSGSRRKVRR